MTRKGYKIKLKLPKKCENKKNQHIFRFEIVIYNRLKFVKKKKKKICSFSLKILQPQFMRNMSTTLSAPVAIFIINTCSYFINAHLSKKQRSVLISLEKCEPYVSCSSDT